jgi:hypothetical protein
MVKANARRIRALALLLLCLMKTATAAEPSKEMTVRLAKAEELSYNPLMRYRVDLMTAALAAEGFKATIIGCTEVDVKAADQRLAMEVRDNEGCDAIAPSAGGENTKGLAVVPVPIYLGSGGIRVLLMTPARLQRAPKPIDLPALRKMAIGSGSTWVDTRIMEFNGIQVERSPVYAQLFVMLKIGRFDAMSRSVFEVDSELKGEAAGGAIVLEPSTVIQYGQFGTDLFFYVSPTNKALRERLTRGLKQMYCSGQMHRLLKTHSSTRDMWELVKPDKHSLVTLKTPDLVPAAEAKALSIYGGEWKSAGPNKKVCAAS